jgi:YNFM family putative membrane transporter
VIFLSFFTFASLLNLLPFRLLELDQTVSTFAIAMVYSGYLIGVVVALGSVALSRRLGGELRAIVLALTVFLVAVVLFAIPNLPMVFVTMWVFCAGMFLVHSVLSGLLNHRASQRKGVVNGIYISSYYLGGTIGSYLPAYIYRHLGWEWYIASLGLLVGLAIIIAGSLKRDLGE